MYKKLSILLILAWLFCQFWGCAPAPAAPGTETTVQIEAAPTQQTDPATQTDPTPEPNPYLQYYDPEWEHILTHSPDDLVAREDLLGLDANALRLARNEIFARHGYCFSDENLRGYFDLCSWYQPDPDKTTTDGLGLTDLERQAVSVILEYEQNPGYDPAGLDTRLCYPAQCAAFSVQLPAYWEDACTVDKAENWLGFNQTINYDQFGGHLFSIRLYETMEEVEYLPDYKIIGTMQHTSGAQYYVVVSEPTDVQFDIGDFSIGQYRHMSRQMGRILATVEGINGYTYTPA